MSASQPISGIARYTFLEAVRNRLFGLTVVGLVCMVGITEFTGELAITETRQIQSALIAAGMRIFAVITVSLFVITSMVREFSDKGFELILALPVPRHVYYLGKFIGFLMLAGVILIATGALLAIYSDIPAVLLWTCSLGCELAIVIALSLLCLFTFSNVTVSFVVVLGFYVLARSMETLQMISISPILESLSFSHQFMVGLLNTVAFVLPSLHEFTRTDWLVYSGSWDQLGPVLVQTLIYVLLLGAAGLFDLYRKDL